MSEALHPDIERTLRKLAELRRVVVARQSRGDSVTSSPAISFPRSVPQGSIRSEPAASNGNPAAVRRRGSRRTASAG